MRQPGPPVHACCMRRCCMVAIQENDLRGPGTMQLETKTFCTLHMHIALHTSHLHFTLHFLHLFISSRLVSSKLFSPHLICSDLVEYQCMSSVMSFNI